jgi:hypothetical protein
MTSRVHLASRAVLCASLIGCAGPPEPAEQSCPVQTGANGPYCGNEAHMCPAWDTCVYDQAFAMAHGCFNDGTCCPPSQLCGGDISEHGEPLTCCPPLAPGARSQCTYVPLGDGTTNVRAHCCMGPASGSGPGGEPCPSVVSSVPSQMGCCPPTMMCWGETIGGSNPPPLGCCEPATVCAGLPTCCATGETCSTTADARFLTTGACCPSGMTACPCDGGAGTVCTPRTDPAACPAALSCMGGRSPTPGMPPNTSPWGP